MGAGVVGVGEVPELVRGFEVLAEAPDGAEKLRELVLSLAVRGRLVPQDRADVPAADLLGKRTIELEDRNAPFPLPDGWAWTTLKLLGEFSGGGTPSKSQPKFWSGSIPWVSPKDMKVRFLRDSQDHIGEAALDASPCHLIPVGALLMVVRGMILAHSFPVAINHVAVTVNQDMKAMVPFRAGLEQYLLLMFEGTRDRVLGLVEHSSHGTCKLPSERLLNLPVAMPPLAEQRRIVARVDELMALIDHFEAARTQREAERTAARDACLAKLCAAANPDEVATAWSTVASHFDTLFTSPDDIAPLRQSILQLAVRGKLVRQDSRDESSGALLERMTRSIQKGKVGRVVPHGGPAPSGIPTPAPYDVDGTWSWAPLGALTTLVTSGSRSWKAHYANSGASFIRSQDIKHDRLQYDQRAFVAVPPGAEGERTAVKEGDLLVTITGANVGKCARIQESLGEAYVSQHVALIRLADSRLGSFAHLWLTAEGGGRGLLLSDSYGAKPGLNLDQLRTLPVPVPPLAEQDRIVARVREFMSLCDQLESCLTAARDASAAFSAAASVLPTPSQESPS